MNEFIVELTIRSLILATIGLGLRFVLISSSAQARAKVLTLTMIGLVILPIGMLLPKWQVTVSKVQEVQAVCDPSVAACPPVATSTSFPLGLILISVAGLLTLRLILSLIRFRKLESALAPATETLADRVRSLTQRARIVLFCPEGEPPMTWGFVNPKIAMPVDSEGWQDVQFRSVVLHEDAHIRRRDWASSIGFRVLTAIYWFNPLVWALRMLFELDSERAADDCVLAEGLDAPEYAERLLLVAQALQPQSGRLPALTMARNAKLKGRLKAILSSTTRRGPIRGWRQAAVLAPLGCGAIAAGLMMPVTERIVVQSCDPAPVVAKKEAVPQLSANADYEFPDFKEANFDVPNDSDTRTLENFDPSKADVPVAQTPLASNQPSASVKSNTKTETAEMTVSDGNGHTISLSNGGDESQDDMEDAREDVEDAMREMKASFEEARKVAGKDAQKAIEEAQKNAEKEMDNVRKELEKNGLSGKDADMAKASMQFAKGITKASLKMAGDLVKNLNINIDLDEKKDKKTDKKPSDDKKN